MKRVRELFKKWWILLIIGILGIGFGIWLVCNPGVGYTAAKLYVLLQFIISGVIGAAYVLSNRDVISGWGWDFAVAIADVVLGIIIACSPRGADALLIFTYSFGLFIEGAFSALFAIRLRDNGVKGWGWVLALGILTAVLAIALMVRPLILVLYVGLFIGTSMISYGASMVVLGVRMSRINAVINQ